MINTTLCYIENEGKYLMMHRNKKENDINRDKWIGVGGKFLLGESPEECLLREVHEETGLTLNHYTLRGILTFVSDACPETEYIYLYTSDSYSGEILKNCREGDLEWIEKSELKKLALWEGDKIFLSLLDSTREFFSLKLVYSGEKLASAVLNGDRII